MYVLCVTESLCSPPETNTTLYVNHSSVKRYKSSLWVGLVKLLF